MTLIELAKIANNYADEQYYDEMIMDFANEAISKINISLDIELPFFYLVSGKFVLDNTISQATQDSDYNDIISESWQRSVLVPYILYSIKANDGSQNESILALQKFNENLKELKRSRSFDIPKKYRLRWFKTTEYEYNLATHKATDYLAEDSYEINLDVLPKLGFGGVNYEDSYIKVILANDVVEYYKLQDNKQAAVFKVGKGW